jgi:hypothetical protein
MVPTVNTSKVEEILLEGCRTCANHSVTTGCARTRRANCILNGTWTTSQVIVFCLIARDTRSALRMARHIENTTSLGGAFPRGNTWKTIEAFERAMGSLDLTIGVMGLIGHVGKWVLVGHPSPIVHPFGWVLLLCPNVIRGSNSRPQCRSGEICNHSRKR